MTCAACNQSTEQHERAHAYSLSLATEGHNDLDVLLTEHLGRDLLDAAWLCEHCGTRGRGTKTTEVLHWPPVLVTTFKRFEFDVRTLRPTKIHRRIRYPMHFPIRDGIMYRLRAVIEHQGIAGGSRYVAYVRAENNAWYYCDDTAVPAIVQNPENILEQQAYMLIYER